MLPETKIVIIERKDSLLVITEWLQSLWREGQECSFLEIVLLAVLFQVLIQAILLVRTLGGAA